MQVKWGWLDQGKYGRLASDYSFVALQYAGALAKMLNYDKGTGPIGTAMDGYKMPPGKDAIIIGGRNSIAEAMEKCGPVAWNSKSFIWSLAVYRKSGSWKQSNMTMLVLTTDPGHAMRDMKLGPSADIKYVAGKSDIDRYFIPTSELAAFVKKVG